jgi:hypothetical protein
METQIDPNVIIDRLEGTSAVARLCNVRPASVSEWRTKGIPRARLMFLRLARPKLFKELEAAAKQSRSTGATRQRSNIPPSS